MYVVFAVGFTDCVPEVAFVPDHPPLAVHDVAFVDDQVIVDEPPDVIDIGEAEIVTIATGIDVTFTVVDCDTPVVLAPLQVSVYVEFAVGETVAEPDVPFVPDHAPLAVQEAQTQTVSWTRDVD